MSDRELGVCDRVLEIVGRRAEAQVRVTTGRRSLTRFANSLIHQNVAEEKRSVTLALVTDGRLARAASNRVDDEGLRSLVERTLEAARLRPPDPEWPGLAPPAPAPPVDHYDEATDDASPRQRAEVVRAFVEAGPGMAGAGYCQTTSEVAGFANSDGQRLAGRSTQATIDGILRFGGADGSGSQTAVDLAALDGARAGEDAAARARLGAEAVELPPGHYEVVLEPVCVADICQFLVAYGFNAKMHADGRSFVHPGEEQLDPALSLWDDATDDRAVGLGFDAEGTPKRRVPMVEAGVSVGLVHDRRTAAKAGTVSTGHAIGGGERFGAYPTNVFLGAAGSSSESASGGSLDEVIGGMARGLLVTDFWYTRILDPKTQVVTGLTRNGLFLVEDGQVSQGVRNLRFTQSYAGALAPGHVRAVAADAHLVNSSAFVPSLHLASWNFTGGARG
ncbi:MAG TPA: TldD/PmbA family protein [Acidimicrobiales bacterium]|nr:TldD/PmbA family protein [Acidimicrobiales bacterium]